ncbi:NACHT domain-containing protein [Streptomyces sp. NPDC057620]|uniref:NACHT domain-containing protein n=1 Tax=Streptomyces sp. NPDC057620 TaxID=3346185 RepID=UPI00368586A7
MLAFRDALQLLGVDPPSLIALDRALGGVLNLVSGGTSETVLQMTGVQQGVLSLGRDAVRRLDERLTSADTRASRTELLDAAHTVVVVVAWFEALDAAQPALPFPLAALELTRREQLLLAGVRTESDNFARMLAAADVPRPGPLWASETMTEPLKHWYARLGTVFCRFLEGLRLWERLPQVAREGGIRAIEALPAKAFVRYQDLYRQLALVTPEFGLWVAQSEHEATRGEVRRALSGIEPLLARTVRALRPARDLAAALGRAHQAVMDRPVLDATAQSEDIRFPTLAESYLDPDFRVKTVFGSSVGGPADETWWQDSPLRTDLTQYLAGALASPALTGTPLLVLGQPGAGKSVLTQVLAARLPAAGFVPVRVPLRDVNADEQLQEQIEQAVKATTGERATWPDLVRSAEGAMPVLLLDGFDELLQTTGLHHNDFLERVARFQQREADQGRPLVALVTSRTAVADRTRTPTGLVVLRLEPFRPEQIRRWLEVWNQRNLVGQDGSDQNPLLWETVQRHEALASQPLLLTMLALYDATTNGLRDEESEPRDEAELYEELLSSFARREVVKTTKGALPAAADDEQMERELLRLGLVAFGALNRRRQWVTGDELDEDLNALLSPPATDAPRHRGTLGHADIAVGRFFFIQQARSVRGGRELATYEFLHATFGEYLAVRLALHLLRTLTPAVSTLPFTEPPVHDDLAYALLSYAPLASRQMLGFARSMVERIDPGERTGLAKLLIRVLNRHETRNVEPHPAYRPQRLRTSARHGIYESNLVLMTVLAMPSPVSASELFPHASDPVGAWHRRCLLWRSALDEQQWTDFALALSMHPAWDASNRQRTLDISLRQHVDPPVPVDVDWLYRYPRGHGGDPWARTYWDEVWHKMSVSGGTNDSVIRHALDPLFIWLGPLITTFVPVRGQRATSMAHDLMQLLLVSPVRVLDPSEAEQLYQRLTRGLPLLPPEAAVRLAHLLAVLVERDGELLPDTAHQHITEALHETLPD